MRRCLKLAVALIALLAAVASARAEPSAVDRVRVFAGTSNSRWQLFPGATVPFGLVKFSPDNQGNVWNGGYEWTVGSIAGFGLLHAGALSGPTLMPVVGPLQIDPTSSRFHAGPADGPFGSMWTAGYRSRIDKATETGSPGYYSVTLADYGVKAEVTATNRVGYMRLTWPGSDESHLLVDFDPPTEEKTDVQAVDFARAGPAEFTIRVRQRNNYAGTHDVFMVLQLTKAPAAVRTWTNGRYDGDDTNYGTAWRRPVTVAPLENPFHGGASTGAILDFTTRTGETVLARVGVSFIDLDGARANLAAETAGPGWDFDRVVAEARASWGAVLDRITVSDERPGHAETFYTDLYRVFAGKSRLDDTDGRYRDATGAIARLAPPADAVYSSDALWGAQWDLFPLWTLAYPETAISFGNALLALAERGGWVPLAPVNLRYSPVMVAQHQDALLVGAAAKRLPGIDPARAYAAIRHDLTTQGVPLPDNQYAGDRQLATYVAHGYVPDEDGPTSNTLEYAYDDSCAAVLARLTGHAEDAAMFAGRAGNWRNQLDPETGYMRPRHADGSWLSPLDPRRFGTVGGWNGRGFVEGTAAMYSDWVPQEPAALAAAIGRDRFVERLDRGLADGTFDLGNEPSLLSPWLFDRVGAPWLTQKWVRAAADAYDTDPLRGWPGEEDEGQLTAYGVLLALGLFEIDGGCADAPAYDLASPSFRHVVIHRPGGRDLTIDAEGAPDIYIRSATWNGATLDGPRLPYAAIAGGGTLAYRLGPEPDRRWGAEMPDHAR